MRNGFKHDIPVNFQIRPFRQLLNKTPLKDISITPAINYSGVAYTQKIIKRFEAGHLNPLTNKLERW